MKGKELGRRFFQEAAEPILREHFPDLVYTAGFTGYGSDMLGYDDEVSQDHMWGPRFYLFLKPEDMHRQGEIMEAFSAGLPETFCGYYVNFSDPDPNDKGVRGACKGENGRVSPLIFIDTVDGFLESYLGKSDFSVLTGADWLSFSEHRLLAVQRSEFWVDKLKMKEKIAAVSYFPETVWRYLIASNWELISQEQAFVKRCASVGDELGSRICCTRIGERLMRLCFLYCRTYAPYSKWFGTAFRELPVPDDIKNSISLALSTGDMLEREHQIALAQKLVCDFQDSLHFIEPVNAEIQPYFGRDIQVIFCDRVCTMWAETLKGTDLEKVPLIGNFSGVGNFTCLYDNPAQHERCVEFYRR